MGRIVDAVSRTTGALCLALLLASCAPIRAPFPAARTHDADAQHVEAILAQAATQLDEGESDRLGATLDDIADGTGFSRLPLDLRYRTLLAAALVAEQQHRDADAHTLATKATRLEGAVEAAWPARLNTAAAIGDYRDAANSLVTLARRWPASVNDFNPDAIGNLHSQLRQSRALVADREMLDALFDAHWQIDGREPSILWRQLVLYHLADHAHARADAVALHITSAEAAIGMLADKRFDSITRRYPRHFDIRRLLAAEIAERQARMAAHPDVLEPITDLEVLFLMTRAYPDVLGISDATVAHVEFGNGKTAYVDFGRWYVWVLDYRARALMREQRFSDAIRVEARAARYPEQGSPNTSQFINLGAWLANLRKPDEAAEAISKAGGVSAFGGMQYQEVKLRIAVDRRDESAIRASMTYMRAHQAEDITGWEEALLLQGNKDAAAALLIHRLADPGQRLGALTDMQHYASCRKTPLDQLIARRWRAVTTRADVRAALRLVGRVRRYDLCAPIR
jgi:hypothetical protein